jgi:II/X family phage/plasmid replication protein
LQRVYDNEVERLLREGKQGMETVRTSREVLRRLKEEFGETRGLQLYGFWTSLCSLGDDAARVHYSRATFFRNRKCLEEAGVSWRGSDLQVVANDGALDSGFVPLRSDHRLCFLPARNRPEYQVSREVLRLAA